MVVVAAASHQVPGHQVQNLHPPSQVPVQVPYIIPRRYVMTNSTGGKQNFIDLTQLTNIYILLLLATTKSLAAMVERLPGLSSVCINLSIFPPLVLKPFKGSIVGALVVVLLIYYLCWRPRRYASLRSRSIGQETGAVKQRETGGLGSWFKMSRKTKPAVQVTAEHDDLGLERKRIISYPASPSGSEEDTHECPKAHV